MRKRLIMVLVTWILSFLYDSFYRDRIGGYSIEDSYPNDRMTQMFMRQVLTGHHLPALLLLPFTPQGANSYGLNKLSPLKLAVLGNHYWMVRLLLAVGADPNGPPDGAPLTGTAYIDDDLRIAQALLDAGANPDGTHGGSRVMDEAITLIHNDLILLLIERGADLYYLDSLGENYFEESYYASNWDIMIYFLDHGLSPWHAKHHDTVGYSLYRKNCPTENQSPYCQGVRRVIDHLKALGWPWPPPSFNEVVKLREAGLWPPPVPAKPPNRPPNPVEKIPLPTFAHLSDAQRTVLVSLYYQFGVHLWTLTDETHPRHNEDVRAIWSAALQGRWNGETGVTVSGAVILSVLRSIDSLARDAPFEAIMTVHEIDEANRRIRLIFP